MAPRLEKPKLQTQRATQIKIRTLFMVLLLAEFRRVNDFSDNFT
jgi:hypothetical protein